MFWLFILILCKVSSATTPDTQVIEYRRAKIGKRIYRYSRLTGPLRGLLKKGDIFAVYKKVGAKEGCGSGVLQVHEAGFLCANKTEVVTDLPIDLPVLLDFIPPQPTDREMYEKSNSWPALEGPKIDGFMPSIHGRRSKNKKGTLYKDVEAYKSGSKKRWRLKTDRDYHFIGAEKTSKGWVLIRPNKKVTPLEDIDLYLVGRFFGRDLSDFPIPTAQFAGWVYNLQGAAILVAPSEDAKVVWHAQFQEPLNIQPHTDKEWYVVPDIWGKGRPGYIAAKNVRRWQPMKRPSQVSDNSFWIDVLLSEQMLALYQGDQLVFLTLISSAKKGHRTPTGLFQIYSKSTAWDLASLANASDQYFIEQDPWVMHYYPRYAIHSAFWHANFGIPSSHGCINLSPRDAKYIFDRVFPELPKGWRTVKQTAKDQGTIVRIRKKTEKVSDKRIR